MESVMQYSLSVRIMRGFSLIELMIVVSLIGILAAMAVPSYQQYAKRARFADVITSAEAYKTAVTLALQEGAPLDELLPGMHGIPDSFKSTKHVESMQVERGVITASATKLLENTNYILKPNSDASVWNISGSCIKKGYCHG
jgi:prepilin-type N-terminal cleavage/methylation domain-containing protein